MLKRWICRKCSHLQREDYSMYHRCSHCGSVDLESILLTEEEIQQHEQVVLA